MFSYYLAGFVGWLIGYPIIDHLMSKPKQREDSKKLIAQVTEAAWAGDKGASEVYPVILKLAFAEAVLWPLSMAYWILAWTAGSNTNKRLRKIVEKKCPSLVE